MLRASYVYTDTVSRCILVRPTRTENTGSCHNMINEAMLMMVAMVALSPAARAASCIASSLIITELGDPASVPDSGDAAKARFIQL